MLAGLLMAELISYEKKPLVKIRDMLFKKYGQFHNARLNFKLDDPTKMKVLNDRLTRKPPREIARTAFWRIDETDGFGEAQGSVIVTTGELSSLMMKIGEEMPRHPSSPD